jgi:hypoxanthine phosphoribosyltransferase
MIKNFMADKLIITFDQYTKIVEKLAIEIYNNYKPTVLVGIMRGAAPILDILSRILKLPIAYIVIQSYSGKGMQDKQGQLMFAREISSLAENKDFDKVLLVDDLSDTGLTLNKSIEWLKKYEPTKNYINEVKTACLWKKKSSTFEPDFCPVKLDSDPWIVQPTEHYEELSMEEIIERNKYGWNNSSPKNYILSNFKTNNT